MRFDHLVVGIGVLDEGVRQFASLAGVTAAEGGRHPGRGTHNALAAIGPLAYLELLAPQPGAAVSGADADLERLDRLTLIDWAVAVDDMDATAAALAAAGFACDSPRPGARDTPSGDRLEWTTLRFTGDVPGAPFFIEWSRATRHPSRAAPTGCTLTSLAITCPAALAGVPGITAIPQLRLAAGPVRMVAELRATTGATFHIAS
jgi:hypothetical protein